jgi:hypothetical protein
MVAGAGLVLSWQVANAAELLLTPTPGAVAGNVIEVAPTAAADWCLEARSASGSDRRCIAVDVVEPSVPPPDVTLRARVLAGGGVLVYWPAEPMASGYAIERTDGFSGPLQPFTTVAGTRYWLVDTSTQANSFYTYRVRATNVAGASAGTTIGSISAPRPPEGPVGPTVTALDGTTVAPGGALRFVANVPVTWILPGGPGAGSITTDGVYEAPAQAGLVLLAVAGNATVLVPIVVE